MNKTLWTKKEILKAITGELRGNIVDNFYSISIDSRSIKQGAIFFAIKGEKFDGHDFVQKAYDNGASLLIIERGKAKDFITSNLPIMLVDDVMGALTQLAIFSRKRSNAKIIAVTGSLGKTSLKEILANVFKLYGETHANYASYNNHWGVPLTLASMPSNCEYGIFELGMNHSGELLKLGILVQPDISIITAIAPAHIGNFVNVKNIAIAKSEIYVYQKPNGLALINADDEYSSLLADIAKASHIQNIKYFGNDAKADYNLLNISEIKTTDLEECMLYNIMATIGVLSFLQLDIKKALPVFKNIKPLDGRGKVSELPIGLNSFLLIDESYNANLTSMKQAIISLIYRKKNNNNRKILVLGDMLELGDYSEQMHRELADIINNEITFIYLIGKEMRYLALELEQKQFVPYLWDSELENILPIVVKNIQANDIIMLKSSNSIGTNKIVNALKTHYR